LVADWAPLPNFSNGINALVTFPDSTSRGKETLHMQETVGIAGDRIRSIVERIEHIEEAIKALNEGKKEIFQEAKGEGFDLKVIKEIIRLRKQDKDERDEHESLLDLYLRAIETCEPEQSKAA
jgi:uncharacterized protein (UPF0335 family)